MKTVPISIIFGLLLIQPTFAQLWNPNINEQEFKNPIIYADYSDPDIIRVGEDFYMVASSFNCSPGIPVLHSNDLINWKIINYVYDRLPLPNYDKPAHGLGSWAPSIRFHNGMYFVYFCTPHDGLFMAQTDHPAHKWELNFVEKVDNWEDPCPIWDEDGQAYLVRSKLCGDELFLHRISSDGKKILDNGVSIVKDANLPTIEGPKFMKKDNYYYILAPSGGVPQGWQTALRSKNIYGPYESKIILHQGNSEINGPHQGGLVELESGEWWFAHFQDKGLYGRIVHLQAVSWMNDWPMMGIDANNDGIGEPVLTSKKPNVGKIYPQELPQTSDEFSSEKLGLQWQWHANWKENWFSLQANPGFMRLNAVKNHSQNGNFWFVPNLLLQKFPAPAFTAKTKVHFNGELNGDRCGLVIMGKEWAYIALTKNDQQIELGVYEGAYQQCEDLTQVIESVSAGNTLYLKVDVAEDGLCTFSYSNNDIDYQVLGRKFQAKQGVWIGAKVGIFCINPNINESKGSADFDWFKIE
ncbi:MAG: glycoside hydrolase 43 family protein [Prolixibacteraceae bacterium]